jgi:hypothetical protein
VVRGIARIGTDAGSRAEFTADRFRVPDVGGLIPVA